MRLIKLALVCLYLSWVVGLPTNAYAQFAFQVTISSPQSGEAIQGIVPVWGTAAVDGFTAYQLSFSLSENLTETWFIITESTVALEDDILGEWDTSNLTDGNYRLRLTVQRESGEPVIIFAERLRVRNYTPIETNTPGPTQTLSPGQTVAPTDTRVPATPTDLPANRAKLTSGQISASFFTGIGGTLLVFLLVGFYSTLRRRRN